MAETSASTITTGQNTRRIVINLHSNSGATAFDGMLNMGEIGISHPSGDTGKTETSILTINSSAEVIEFKSKEWVESQISSAVTEINSKISAATVSSNDETVTVTTGADGTDLSVNIDNNTIVKGANGVLSVSTAATSVSGKDAIKVTDNNGKQVELVIAAANKVLSQTTNGLDTTLGVKFVKASENTADGANKGKAVIQLTGISGEVISEIDATDLVMDGVLDKVELDGGKLTFTWNTDAKKTATTIDLGDYIKPYFAGNGLNLTNETFSVKINENETYLTVDGNGIATTGIDAAIAAAKAAATTKVEKSSDSDGSHITIISATDETTSAVTYTIKESDIASASALTAEIANRKKIDGVDGDTYTAKSDATYISAATSLHGADVILDAAIKGVSDKVGTKDVSTQISEALDKLDVDPVGGTGKVITTISEADGKISATAIDLTATAVSATAVGEGTATNVQGILEELSDAIGTVSGSAISVKAGNGIDITGTGTEKTIAAKVNSGDKYIEVTDEGIASKGIDTAISDAINLLDATGGTTTVADGTHVAVQVVEENGKITTVTVTEDDIASAGLLKTVIENVGLTTGGTYTQPTSGVISGATSVNDAIGKLDTKISSLNGESVKSVKMNGTEKTPTNNVVDLGAVVTGIGATTSTGTDEVVTLQCNIKFDTKTGLLDFSNMIIDCGTF